jgi:hypothetical protein
MNKRLGKCNFCKYWTGSSCRVTPNSYYCKEAIDEYNQYAKGTQPQAPIKSFRKWDKR